MDTRERKQKAPVGQGNLREHEQSADTLAIVC